MEPHELIRGKALVRGEGPSHVQISAPVCRRHHDKDRVVKACSDHEGRVDRSIWFETHEAVHVDPVVGAEVTADIQIPGSTSARVMTCTVLSNPVPIEKA